MADKYFDPTLPGKLCCFCIFALAAILFGSSSPVLAQSSTDQELLDCDRISNSVDRLACIESVISRVKARASPGSVTRLESYQVEPDPEASPPAKTPVVATPSTLDRPEKRQAKSWARELPDRFEAKIIRMRDNGIGTYYFTMDDGSVWKRAHGPNFNPRRAVNRKAEIYKGATGAWRMKIEGVPVNVWVVPVKSRP